MDVMPDLDGNLTSSPSRKQAKVRTTQQDDTVSIKSTRETPTSQPSAMTPLPNLHYTTNTPPWVEWSDEFINAEKWDTDAGTDFFEDTFAAMEILQLKYHHWVRPSEFVTETPTVVKFNSSMVDLISPNAHLCEQSEILRYILSEISELYEYSLQNTYIECEGEGVAYIPNYPEDERRWTPWSHIYSCCKAGVRGEKPNYNTKGKYYVRLYFMGAWRRIIVDDRIPVSHSGKSCLPLSAFSELWPMLLIKAVLKVAAVTWKGSDVSGFSTISALTGWIFEWVNEISEDGMDSDQLWGDLQSTLPKYNDPRRIPSAYTLLKSPRKGKFGSMDSNEPLWWLNASVTPPISIREIHFRDDDDETLTQPQDDEEGKSKRVVLEMKWRRKSDASARSGGTIVPTSIKINDEEAHHAISGNLKSKGGLNKKSAKLRKDGSKHDVKGAKKNVKLGKEKEKEKEKKSEKVKKEGEDHAAEKLVGLAEPHKSEEDEHLNPDQEAHRQWSNLKHIVLGHSNKDFFRRKQSKSVRQSIVDRIEEMHLSEREEEDTTNDLLAQSIRLQLLPSISEILYGVQKYAGIDYRFITQRWENVCGKDAPTALVVVFRSFPPLEDIGPNFITIPSYLQHPVHLTEVRDTPYQETSSERPLTPLWKRFRWKSWAMKKGLIPLEKDHSNEVIRAVRAKTPFLFKTDWKADYESTDDSTQNEDEAAVDMEIHGEGDEDEDDFSDVVNYDSNLTKSFFMNFKDAMSEEILDAFSGTPPPQGTPPSETSPPPSKPKNKSIYAGEKELSPPHTDLAKGMRASHTVILHEAEIAEGESEEDLDEGFKKMFSQIINVSPMSACKNVWLNCDDIAQNLRKFCKFYTSQSLLGSCYNLRNDTMSSTPAQLDPTFQDIHSDLPKYPRAVKEYKLKKDSYNLSIEFDRFKTYSVTSYHLDENEGVDSAFYIFSDGWKDQELIISVKVLQESLLKIFEPRGSPPFKELPVPPPTPNVPEAIDTPAVTPVINEGDKTSEDESGLKSLHLVIEPWDWRVDCIPNNEPLITASIKNQWLTHIRLPPGRKTYRLWLAVKNEAVPVDKAYGIDTADEGDEEGSPEEPRKPKCSIPFSVRIISQTPTYVGSRIEVQNYMTNLPMLYLKQCENLSNGLWGLFACFGKKRIVFQENLRQLRRCYRPTSDEPLPVSKKEAKVVHETFEEMVVSLVTQMNDGDLDKMLLLTLRVLFLNPMLGRNFGVQLRISNKSAERTFKNIFRSLGAKAKGLISFAAKIIQKYYRGWRVRRLFQMRNKSHPSFHRIAYNVRRISYMLASETESVYTHAEEHMRRNSNQPFPRVSPDLPIDPDKVPPSVLPQPPAWSVDLLSNLTDRHPWLTNIYPHAKCTADHIKIQEVEGEYPPAIKDYPWYPFFKRVLRLPANCKSCFCEIDLQVYPTAGIFLNIINNDTKTSLALASHRKFIGQLIENKEGYTVLAYRWEIPISKCPLNERVQCNLWKLRLLTPSAQGGLIFDVDSADNFNLIHDLDEVTKAEKFDRVSGSLTQHVRKFREKNKIRTALWDYVGEPERPQTPHQHRETKLLVTKSFICKYWNYCEDGVGSGPDHVKRESQDTGDIGDLPPDLVKVILRGFDPNDNGEVQEEPLVHCKKKKKKKKKKCKSPGVSEEEQEEEEEDEETDADDLAVKIERSQSHSRHRSPSTSRSKRSAASGSRQTSQAPTLDDDRTTETDVKL